MIFWTFQPLSYRNVKGQAHVYVGDGVEDFCTLASETRQRAPTARCPLLECHPRNTACRHTAEVFARNHALDFDDI
jgi:hypothetical protein